MPSVHFQTLHFLTSHDELLSLILRGSAARSSLHPSLLQELSLTTAVVSRAASISTNINTDDVVDATGSVYLLHSHVDTFSLCRCRSAIFPLPFLFSLNSNLYQHF